MIETLNNMNLSTDSVLWGEKPTRHHFPSNIEQWEDIFGSRTVWTIANVTAMKPPTPLRYNFMIKLHPEDQKINKSGAAFTFQKHAHAISTRSSPKHITAPSQEACSRNPSPLVISE